MTRPTLLGSCASATTAAEARYRIDAPPPTPRSTRVIALDEGAGTVIERLFELPWGAARFLRYRDAAQDGTDGELADLVLRTADGERVRLSDELAEADFVMMVATADEGAAAAAIGNACTLRGIMTAGLVLGDARGTSSAVAALRPNARVLLLSNDQQDLTEVLTAVRA